MGKTIKYGSKGGLAVTVNYGDLLAKIQKLDGDVEQATWDAARKGARVLYDQLQSECTASGVPASVKDAIAMQAERSASGNRFACKVGWRMSPYDPQNLTPAYKAIFLNYGTPRRHAKDGVRVQINGRWVTLPDNRGYIDGRGFMGRAKKKARPKVKKTQEEVLKTIIEGLEK